MVLKSSESLPCTSLRRFCFSMMSRVSRSAWLLAFFNLILVWSSFSVSDLNGLEKLRELALHFLEAVLLFHDVKGVALGLVVGILQLDLGLVEFLGFRSEWS